MTQLPPRHSDPLLRFYHLLAVLELVHRLRVVPACSVVEDALVGGQVGVATDRGQLDPLPVAQVDEVLQLARLPAITVPTVVLHGADNGVSPARSSEGQARLFVGRYVRRLIPLVGHNVPQEAPEEFASAILSLTA